MEARRFERLRTWGGIVLAALVATNVYVVLRYREAYRQAARLEAVYARDLAVLNARQQALEGVLRDFAARAGQDPHVADVLRRHGLDPAQLAAGRPR